jgi:hypothetical protein
MGEGYAVQNAGGAAGTADEVEAAIGKVRCVGRQQQWASEEGSFLVQAILQQGEPVGMKHHIVIEDSDERSVGLAKPSIDSSGEAQIGGQREQFHAWWKAGLAAVSGTVIHQEDTRGLSGEAL